MSTTDWITMIALGEFALLVTIVLAILLIWLRRRRRRDRDAAAALRAKIDAGRAARQKMLGQLLAERFHMDPDDAGAAAEALTQSEDQFYEHFLETYLKRDSDAVRHLDDTLESTLAAFLELGQGEDVEGAHAEETDSTGEPPAKDRSEEVTRLRRAVENLSEDLSLYRSTLNRVFSEYTAMFGVHIDPMQELTAKEIIERLESGQLTGDEEEESGDESATDSQSGTEGASADEEPPDSRTGEQPATQDEEELSDEDIDALLGEADKNNEDGEKKGE